MPFLMVNLDDPADCRRGLEHLWRLAGGRGPGRGPGMMRRPGGPPPPGPGCGPRGGRGPGREWMPPPPPPPPPAPPPPPPPGMADPRDLPLGQKLRLMRRRGMWPHLVAIARQGDAPRSLTEWDEAIGLQPNQMRSLKAIMAKLERRFGLSLLVPAADAGPDAAGNPRYVMPPRVRKKILELAGEGTEE